MNHIRLSHRLKGLVRRCVSSPRGNRLLRMALYPPATVAVLIIVTGAVVMWGYHELREDWT